MTLRRNTGREHASIVSWRRYESFATDCFLQIHCWVCQWKDF